MKLTSQGINWGAVAAIVVSFLVAAAVVITSLVSVFSDYADDKLKLEEKRLKGEAIHQCGQVATATWRDVRTGATLSVPYKKAYGECLQDKGYVIGISGADDLQEGLGNLE